MTVDALVDALIALAAEKGADDYVLSAMRMDAFAGEHEAVIAEAVQVVDPAFLDDDLRAAYVAYRESVTLPGYLELLPDISGASAA